MVVCLFVLLDLPLSSSVHEEQGDATEDEESRANGYAHDGSSGQRVGSSTLGSVQDVLGGFGDVDAGALEDCSAEAECLAGLCLLLAACQECDHDWGGGQLGYIVCT